MPCVEKSLEQWNARHRQPNAASVAKILLQILKGLANVGELVHRDLKPASVLWHKGQWKIADCVYTGIDN